jgi:hypothetical protein
MSTPKVVVLLGALVVAGIAAILAFAPNAESGECAVKLMLVLFSKSSSLMDAPLPDEAVLVTQGRRRTLSIAELERLHEVLSEEELPGDYPGVNGTSVQSVKIADLKVTYPGGRLSFPIYQLIGTKIYRVEISATGLNSLFFIKDDSSRFEKFLTGEVVNSQKGTLLMNPK